MLLDEYWITTCNQINMKADNALFDLLIERYQESHRHYHTVNHLQECFDYFEAVKTLCEHPGEVACALWFHDAVYDPQKKDNELQSAKLARGILINNKIPMHVIERIAALILSTSHQEVAVSMDAKILLDIDLGILGAKPDRFIEYEQQIRAEYAWVPKEIYQRERGKILRGFIERPQLYAMQWFKDNVEHQARENLAISLKNLEESN
ncbi:MAG: N-methyl-D-aspartate receptor NMDAR2C subunit [Pseudomonadota bacterium]